jgi:RNA polymerase sigma factor (sigma-70 family)
MTDWELLRQYVESASSDAFAQLVARHIDMVYTTARRQVRDSHLAEDVTQAVFILLARRAGNLKSSIILGGWLYQAARLSALAAMRDQRRRKHHEKIAAEAQLMRTQSDNPALVWQQIEPELDEALGRLGRKDRDAIVLRFLQGYSMAETGTAIGLSESAAKMRVHRAVARLRKMLAGAHVETTSPILMTALASAFDSARAPIALAESAVSAATVAGKGTTISYAIAKGVNTMMTWVKVKMGIAVTMGLVLAGTTAVVGQSLLTKSRPPAILVAAADVAKPSDATARASDSMAIKVSVTFRQIKVDDKNSDWDALRKRIESIPVEQRRNIRLELSAISGDLPVSSFFDAQNRAGKIVKELGLNYVSITGIQAVPGDSDVKGEYYIGGHLLRDGVYSLTGRQINLKQALIAAGLDDISMGLKVDVIRRTDTGKETFVKGISISDLFDGTKPDFYLMPYDQVMVK